MSDDQERKTEEPTDRRLRDARQEGQVVRSRDVTSAVVIAAGMLALWLGHEWLLSQGKVLVKGALNYAPSTSGANAVDGLKAQTMAMLVGVASVSLLVAAITAVVATLTGAAQTRALVAFAAVKPDAERIDPAQGLKNIWSVRSVMELLRSTLKVLLIGGALAWIAWTSLPGLVRLPYLDVEGVYASGVALGMRFLGLALCALGVVAVFDHWFQDRDFRKRLRMTREEVKRERRDSDGDPHVRSRRRSIAMQDMNQTEFDRVRQASLLIYGAQESFTVAVYDNKQAGKARAIYLIAKGAGTVGRSMLAVAKDSNVKTVRNASLAAALYRNAGVDNQLEAQLAKRVLQHLSVG
jgi:flagellar biosynthesis protein FlhB